MISSVICVYIFSQLFVSLNSHCFHRLSLPHMKVQWRWMAVDRISHFWWIYLYMCIGPFKVTWHKSHRTRTAFHVLILQDLVARDPRHFVKIVFLSWINNMVSWGVEQTELATKLDWQVLPMLPSTNKYDIRSHYISRRHHYQSIQQNGTWEPLL